jgi:hypothetical protein
MGEGDGERSIRHDAIPIHPANNFSASQRNPYLQSCVRLRTRRFVSIRSASIGLNDANLMGSAAVTVRANLAVAITLTVKLITPDLMGAERT